MIIKLEIDTTVPDHNVRKIRGLLKERGGISLHVAYDGPTSRTLVLDFQGDDPGEILAAGVLIGQHLYERK